MSASSRTPPSEMRTYSRPIARAIDLATEVLPTPGGPTKSRIGPLDFRLLLGGRGRHDLVLAEAADLVEAATSSSADSSPPRSAASSALRVCSSACRSWRTARNSSTRSLTSPQAVVILVEDLGRRRDVEMLVGCACSTAARRWSPGRCGSPGDSIASRPMRLEAAQLAVDLLARRPSGSVERGELARAAPRCSSAASSPSPSSFWIALSCSRRNISRWRSPSSSWTLVLMSSWASSTSSCRWTWTSTRRMRSSTERVSSSIWRCVLLQVGVAGHEVGEPARLVHPLEHLLDDLLGQAGLGAQLRRALPQLPGESDESRILRVQGLHLLGLADDGLQMAVLLDDLHRDSAVFAVEQKLHAGEPALELADAGHGADGVEHLGGDRLNVLPLRDREDQPPRRVQSGFDRLQGGGLAGVDRRRHTRQQYEVPQRRTGRVILSLIWISLLDRGASEGSWSRTRDNQGTEASIPGLACRSLTVGYSLQG